jgi:uncharacterized protein
MSTEEPFMESNQEMRCTAFAGMRRMATGSLVDVALTVKAALDAREQAGVLIFDDATSEPVEVDWRGTPADVVARIAPTSTTAPAPRGPGRPKLGVVAREVTLLPRHWDWLATQPGGASVALRKLTEQAIREHSGTDRIRRAQEAAYRFMTAMAGNLSGYEEATRALFAGDGEAFAARIAPWPDDVRDYALRLAFPTRQSHGSAIE